MSGRADFHHRVIDLVDAAIDHVIVTLVDRRGSVPQDVGSRMIVIDPTASSHRLVINEPADESDGPWWGTVGGGRVEATAIKHALAILGRECEPGLVRWNLNADLSMTCGGRVELFFECYRAKPWSIEIFGAGHVSQSLCRVLTSLPCHVTVRDPRSMWIERLPPGVDGHCQTFTPSLIDTLDERSFIVCMTRGHHHDLPVLEAIAKSGKSFPYIGVIGSKTKAGVLRRELRERGVDTDRFQFHCPIGLPIGSNHPGEIAISITAELLQQRDRRQTETHG